MIIGTITLITLLLTGGTMSTFVFEDIEKYVNSEVTDGNRKKDITDDLTAVNKEVKAYQERRTEIFERLRKIVQDRNSTNRDFEDIKAELYNARLDLDEFSSEKRVEITNKLTNEEWDQIVANEIKETESQQVKDLEKQDQEKMLNGFKSVMNAISENIEDQSKKESALKAAESFQKKYDTMEISINSRFSIDNEVLINKNASADDLMKVYNSLSSLKRNAFWGLQDFHINLKELTNDNEWKKIMKEVNKLIR